MMITTVDIGATKTLIGQFDSASSLINESRFATPAAFEAFLPILLEHLNSLDNITQLVVAVPGLISTDGTTVVRCGNLPWYDVPLKRILSDRYNCPVVIENDAKLAALAEVKRLSPMPRLGLYLTISTGIGSGVVIDGKIPEPLTNSEAGHIAVYDGGKFVTWESIASGKAVVDHFKKLSNELTDPADQRWIADRLCLGLYSIIPFLQPDVIIFGGGAGLSFDNYREYVTTNLNTNLPTDFIHLPELKVAHYGHQSVLYGCQYYARHSQTN